MPERRKPPEYKRRGEEEDLEKTEKVEHSRHAVIINTRAPSERRPFEKKEKVCACVCVHMCAREERGTEPRARKRKKEREKRERERKREKAREREHVSAKPRRISRERCATCPSQPLCQH